MCDKLLFAPSSRIFVSIYALKVKHYRIVFPDAVLFVTVKFLQSPLNAFGLSNISHFCAATVDPVDPTMLPGVKEYGPFINGMTSPHGKDT